MDITITRDRWGIAHVEAPTAAAAFEAQGYCAAADRIWQMEWDRRKLLGRWAEVVGAPGLGEDRFFRRLGLAAAARADWSALTAEARAMTEAYAAGVNAWLDANVDSLPAEFDTHPAPPARCPGW